MTFHVFDYFPHLPLTLAPPQQDYFPCACSPPRKRASPYRAKMPRLPHLPQAQATSTPDNVPHT
eukprot:1164032-Ditylum_brightwellii.AAC.1